MTETLTYRDSTLNLVPRWLKGFWGARLLYSIGVTLDALGDSVDQGIKARFPGQGDTLALALQGRSKGITRGPGETDTSYANRLRYWRLSRKRKGNAFSLLEQLEAYLQPPSTEWAVKTRIITDNGTRYTLAPGGFVYAPQSYKTAPTNTVVIDSVSWNYDGTTHPERYWVLLYNTVGTLWSRDGTWADSGLWNDYNTSDGSVNGTVLDPLSSDPSPTYGSTASYSTVSGILALVRDWSPPSSVPVSMILCFDETTFDTISPGGTWGNPGNRPLNVVFWDL